MTDDTDRKEPPEPQEGPREVVWERWDEVDSLLERVLDLPVVEREGFLREACADDPELLRAVRALARDGSEGLTSSLAPGAGILRAALIAESGAGLDDPESCVGTMAGAYRLVRVVGTGGMGAVFAAERADDAYQHTVAVKMLRASVSTPEVVARFELERQILATLNHPAIARLVDGGVHATGRPYLVMEFVEGLRIDEWADRNRLGVDERLGLVMGVMEAVEHAHRHMVVHRDLKPGNILVRDDGSIKLLDFGIARLLDAPTGEAAVTRTGGRFLTPEYAAPEQLLGEPASTQTDVYSIGMLLYELLTGTRPYQANGGASILEQVVQGAEPTAPSSAIPPANTAGAPAGSDSVGPNSVYSARSTSHETLRRRLRGDIDAILMRALRARPSERYSTVGAFREDLERHLTGKAVLARGNAKSYRLRKFVHRHRWPVAAAAGIVLLTTGSAIGLAIQRGSLIEQREAANEATERASRDAATARAATDFLVNLFEANDPSPSFGDTLTARALLERGVQRIDSDLASQPALRAQLLATLGSVHFGLGQREEALTLHERAVALTRDSVPGREGLPRTLLGLARTLNASYDLKESERVYRETVSAATEEGDTITVAWARIGLGRTLSQLDRVEEAEVELRGGLALLPPLSADSEDAWAAQSILAGIVRRKGNLAGADSLLWGVVTARRERPGGDAVNYTAALNDLAVVRRMREMYGDAARLYEEALDTANLRFGPAHPTTLTLRGNYASTLRHAGRLDDAISTHAATIAASREEWPDGHWRTAQGLMEMGATFIAAGRPEEAIDPLSEAVDLGIEQIGRYHSWTNVYRAWLGVAAALTGRDAGAAQLFAWSLEGLEGYEVLRDDLNVVAMVEALVREMEAAGLHDQAIPFAALLEDPPDSS